MRQWEIDRIDDLSSDELPRSFDFYLYAACEWERRNHPIDAQRCFEKALYVEIRMKHALRSEQKTAG
jgi:hypothetical protein